MEQQQPPEEGKGRTVYLDGMLSPRRQPTAEALEQIAEGQNLAVLLDEEEAKLLAQTCLNDYDGDVESRAPRMRRIRDLNEMYSMVVKPKNFPHQKAANIPSPLLTAPTLQIELRMFDMVWPTGGKLVWSMPTTVADLPNALVTEKFANSYIRYKMPEMGAGLRDTIHQVVLYGSGFRRTYWDAHEKRVRCDWIPIDDFVVAHRQRSQDPSMRDVPRYTYVQHMSLYQLMAIAEDGVYANVDRLKPGDERDRTVTSELRESVAKIDGVSLSDTKTTEADKPRQVLEQHRCWPMPNRPDVHPAFDGKEHKVVVTIDEATGTLLRLALREEDEPEDVLRNEKRMSEWQAMVAQAQQQYAMVAQAAVTQGLPPPPPPADPPMPEAVPPRKREICFFTHYKGFSSEGFYGLGYGDILFGLAKAYATLINQHIDGVTFRNAIPGFVSRQARFQRGAISIEPGKINELDVPASTIKDAIMFLDPPKSDPATVPLATLFQAMVDKIAGSSDMMSGQIPGSNNTAKGMAILVEQAMTPITVFGRIIIEAFTHDLEKIWRCWGVFLEDEEVVDVVSEIGKPEQVKIGRAMFTPTARVVPAADPRIKSQRIEETMQIYQAVLQSPFIAQSPNAGAVLEAVTVDVLRALGAERVIAILQTKPPPPPPPQPQPQWAENAGFLTGKDAPVLPDDNDEEHEAELLAFLQSSDAQRMDKPGREMAERHLRAHTAQRIMKRGAAVYGPGAGPQNMGGPDGGGRGPVPPPPPDGALPPPPGEPG